MENTSNINHLLSCSSLLKKKETNDDVGSNVSLTEEQDVKKEKDKAKKRSVMSKSSRELHNEKERKRRLRMKHSCMMLRSLIPGVNEKTDKATVLEYTVQFLLSLQRKSFE